MRHRALAPILVLLIAAAVVTQQACAANTKARLWQADHGIAQGLFTLQEIETAFTRSNVVPSWTVPNDADGRSPHNRFNVHLTTALRVGRAFHLVVKDWPAQQSKTELSALVAALAQMSHEITQGLPPGPNRDKLKAALETAEVAVLLVIPILVE